MPASISSSADKFCTASMRSSGDCTAAASISSAGALGANAARTPTLPARAAQQIRGLSALALACIPVRDAHGRLQKDQPA